MTLAMVNNCMWRLMCQCSILGHTNTPLTLMYQRQYTPEQLALQAKIREEYPYLQAREAGKKISGPALASKNIRRILKRNFPKVKFSVTSDIYSMGSSVYVHWDEDINTPTNRQVEDLVFANFSSTRPNPYDGSDYDNDPWRCAFRALFGSASSVITQMRRFTPEEIAQRHADKLKDKTPEVSTSTRKHRL